MRTNEEYRDSLARHLSALRLAGFVPLSAQWLIPRVAAITRDLRESVLTEVPAFTESANPEVLPDLESHTAAHTQEFIRLLGGAPPGDFGFVQEHARLRASQRFPLEATLHAYRCSHKVIARWMRDVAAALTSEIDCKSLIGDISDFALEYTDTISTVATNAYVDQTRKMINVEGDRRSQLLTILLDGFDESDGRVSRLLRSAGYLDTRQSYCVVLAQPVDATEMLNPSRASRLVESINQILMSTNTRSNIGIRNEHVVAVISHARRSSGWTAPRSSLAATIMPELSKIGPAAVCGISNDAPSTSFIPTAYREAGLAIEMADVRTRVVQISDVPIQRLMLQLCGADILSALPAWSQSFITADRRSRGKLVATLRAYADASMNVLRAAKSLSVHPNTIYARMQKIEDVTGLDARTYRALNDLLQIANCYAAFAA